MIVEYKGKTLNTKFHKDISIVLLDNCETGIEWFDKYVHDVLIEIIWRYEK